MLGALGVNEAAILQNGAQVRLLLNGLGAKPKAASCLGQVGKSLLYCVHLPQNCRTHTRRKASFMTLECSRRTDFLTKRPEAYCKAVEGGMSH